MDSPRLLKFGPEPPSATERRAYVALEHLQHRLTQVSGDYLVGREHSSLASLEAEVEQMRRDLNEILRRARERSGQKHPTSKT